MIFIADSIPPPALCPRSNGSAVLNSDDKIRIGKKKVSDMQYERPCSNSKYFFNNRFYLADQIRNVLLDFFSSEYFVQIWIGRRVLNRN